MFDLHTAFTTAATQWCVHGVCAWGVIVYLYVAVVKCLNALSIIFFAEK